MKYKQFTIAMLGMFLQARNADGFVRFEVRASMGGGGYTQKDCSDESKRTKRRETSAIKPLTGPRS